MNTQEPKKPEGPREPVDMGIFLKQAIAEFYEDNAEDSLLTVMAILTDCPVWVPCQLVGKEDDEPQKYLSREGVLLAPEILENDGRNYYIVFSSQDEMGQYRSSDLLITRCPFMDVLGVAKAHRAELEGIVINVFNEPLALPWDLLEVLESMAPKPDDFSYMTPTDS